MLSPGNSPWGNSPRSPPALPGSAVELLPGSAPDWPLLADELPWLPEELLEGALELLDGELLEELEGLLDELLLGGLPLLLGGVEALGLGGEGVCGVVGLLALGQPLSNRQAQASVPNLEISPPYALFNVKCPDKFVCPCWLATLKTGPKLCLPQLTHQSVGLAVADVVVIHALQVYHSPAIADPEF